MHYVLLDEKALYFVVVVVFVVVGFYFRISYVLKKLLTKRKVNSQIGKVEIKLILLTVHYSLFQIIGVAIFTYVYNNRITNIFSKFLTCESTGVSDCQQYFSVGIPINVLIGLVLMVWLLSPIMTILKVNVFSHIKNCYQRTCSKNN